MLATEDGSSFTAIPDMATVTNQTTISGKVDTAQADLDIITGADGVNLLSATQTSIDAIETDTNSLNNTKIPDTISLANINAEVDTALSDIHLDHLLAADYDPAAKPGTATALLNELVENDGGVSRFTANALEEAPAGGGGGDATEAKQDEILEDLADIKGTGFVKDTHSLTDITEDVTGLNGDAMRGTDGANTTTPDNSGIADAKAAAEAVETLLTELTEDDGGGNNRYTAKALEEAPAGGGGGDATEAKQDEILEDLADIKGTGFAKDTHSLPQCLTGGDATEAKQDEILEDLAALSAGSGAGLFAIPLTIKLGDGSLVADCDVVVTTSPSSPNTGIYASGRTSANGGITVNADAGTYYIWRQKSGIDFNDNPRKMVVDSDGGATIT